VSSYQANRKIVAKIFVRIAIVLLLTALTQVGGVVYLLWLLISSRFRKNSLKSWPSRLILFLGFYLIIVAFVVPPSAQLFHKERLPYASNGVHCGSVFYWLCCRNYVAHGIGSHLEEIAAQASESCGEEVVLVYLDAGFPLLNSCPLLPHLSHVDGKQVDLAFCFADENGTYQKGSKKNLLGYGIYEEPRPNESNTNELCSGQGFWQYDVLGTFAHDWKPKWYAGEYMNKIMLEAIEQHPQVRRIFVEPHLKQRWQLGKKVKFHGCHAVRHDDHIHIDFK
jgi:hypothetical protein